jgi:hypothetical protein
MVTWPPSSGIRRSVRSGGQPFSNHLAIILTDSENPPHLQNQGTWMPLDDAGLAGNLSIKVVLNFSYASKAVPPACTATIRLMMARPSSETAPLPECKGQGTVSDRRTWAGFSHRYPKTAARWGLTQMSFPHMGFQWPATLTTERIYTWPPSCGLSSSRSGSGVSDLFKMD